MSAIFHATWNLLAKRAGADTPFLWLAYVVGATVFLLTYVLPKFAAIYAGKQAILPLPTRILMGISNFVVSHWLALPAALVLLRTRMLPKEESKDAP